MYSTDNYVLDSSNNGLCEGIYQWLKNIIRIRQTKQLYPEAEAVDILPVVHSLTRFLQNKVIFVVIILQKAYALGHLKLLIFPFSQMEY